MSKLPGSVSDKTIFGGAYSSWPTATPNYATNTGRIDTDFKDTVARIYLAQKEGLNQTVMHHFAHHPRLKGLVAKLVGKGYIEFLLQRATHTAQEKVEVVETLADRYTIYTFGAEPPTYSYDMILLNDRQNDQATNWRLAYEWILRSYAMAEWRTEVCVQYNRMLVQGTIVSSTDTLLAADESYCQASFNLIARKVTLQAEASDDYYDATAVPDAVPWGVSVSTSSTEGGGAAAHTDPANGDEATRAP